jgi:hypothetical protein
VADQTSRGRVAAISRRLRTDPGTVRAADAIELVAAGALSPAQLDLVD